MTSHQTQERRAFPLRAATAEGATRSPHDAPSAPIRHLISPQLLIAWVVLLAVGLCSLAGWAAIWLAVSGVIDWIERIAG